MYFLALAIVALSLWVLLNAMQSEPQVRSVAVREQMATHRQSPYQHRLR